MFTLHPTEPTVKIILNSSLGFAPTSLTLAAEACAVQLFIKVNGFPDNTGSLSDPPPPYLLYLIYIYLQFLTLTARPEWGICALFQLKTVTEDKEEDAEESCTF